MIKKTLIFENKWENKWHIHVYRRGVGYVVMMHLPQSYMLTENNSVRIESMTDHPSIWGSSILNMF